MLHLSVDGRYSAENRNNTTDGREKKRREAQEMR